MASQPQSDQSQVPIPGIQDGLSSSRVPIRPEGAPRTRSSTYYQTPKISNEENLEVTAVQSPTNAQTNSTPNEQPPTAQTGPPVVRPVSYYQPPATPTAILRSDSARGSLGAITRSPFSSPITCPPRTRPNQVLLINPTSQSTLTNLILSTVRPILPHALELTAYQAPYPAPTVVESVVDSILSSETVLRDLVKYSTNNGETIQNFDGLLVASYSKHPLIDALRESYDVPVIGIMEASLYVARMLGARFGIISTSTRIKIQTIDAVEAYGLTHFCVGVENLHINPLDLLSPSFLRFSSPPEANPPPPSTPSTSSKSQEELQRRLVTQTRALVAKGADTIILGSEFLASTEASRAVKDALRGEDGRRTVNVVDAVEAGIMMLNGLISMGMPTSKKGVYRSETDGRRARGQTWL